MASRKRIVICYILLQASFWGMLSSICAYQAAVVLDRGFTAGQAGIFCALCYFASLFTQPVIGGWADRHPEVPLKRLLIVMLLPAIALNLVFYFTRPNFLLTALTFFLFGVLETNSYPLIDSMGMQYVNAGMSIPYSLSRGIGSLSYALLCVATGLLTARFGMQTALLAHCAEQLVMLVCLLLFPSIPAQLLPQPQKGAAEGHSALQILRGSRTFTLMLIACFFGMMGVMPISGFLVTLVTSRGGDSRALGLAQFLMAASELPSALVFGLLRKRLSSAKILLISIVFMAVKPLLILASGSLGDAPCRAARADAGLRAVLPGLGLFCERIRRPRRPGPGPVAADDRRHLAQYAAGLARLRVSARSRRHDADALVLGRLRSRRNGRGPRRARAAEKTCAGGTLCLMSLSLCSS